MTRRDAFAASMRREARAPATLDLELSPAQLSVFRQNTGLDSPLELTDAAVRRVSPVFTGDAAARFARYHDLSTPGLSIGAWGIGYLSGRSHHFTEKVSPMRTFTSLSQVEAYPYPDGDADFDWARFEADVLAARAADAVPVGNLVQTLFEVGWQMRGMEDFLADVAEGSPLVGAHIARLAVEREKMAVRMARAGCEVLFVGDDVATQRGMMMSKRVWLELFAPHMKRIVAAAKAVNPRLLVAYHSCGAVSEIIPELIGWCVDILNPVQPECNDLSTFGKEYGRDLVFWGGIGTQSLLPYGTVEQVEAAARGLMESLGGSGGLIVAPAHVVEPEVPYANIDALIRAVRTHNGRRGLEETR